MKSLRELFKQKDLLADHNPFKPHRLNFFAILIIESGQVNHQLDFKNYALSKGDCLIISKNQIHAFDANAVYDGYLVLFTEAFLFNHISQTTISKISRLYNYLFNPSVFHSFEENKQFIDLIKAEIAENNVFGHSNILAALLSVYLLKLERFNQQNTEGVVFDRNYEIFEAFKQGVVSNFDKTRDAKAYAQDLSISYKHLNEICKNYTHKTAKAFIDDYVILEIKRHLSTSTLSIKEVCYACGFDEPTNFLKYFKKQTGETPTQFKAKYA